MNIVDLKEGIKCFHKGHIYEVKNITKLKYVKDENDFSAIWEHCVIYQRIDNPSDLSTKGPFVRRVDDFVRRFEIVNIEGNAQPLFIPDDNIISTFTK